MKSVPWNCACIRPLLANLVTIIYKKIFIQSIFMLNWVNENILCMKTNQIMVLVQPEPDHLLWPCLHILLKIVIHSYSTQAVALCYCTAGFVCEIKICANSARCNVVGLQILISQLTLIPLFQLSHCWMCHSRLPCCDLIALHLLTSILRE